MDGEENGAKGGGIKGMKRTKGHNLDAGAHALIHKDTPPPDHVPDNYLLYYQLVLMGPQTPTAARFLITGAPL